MACKDALLERIVACTKERGMASSGYSVLGPEHHM